MHSPLIVPSREIITPLHAGRFVLSGCAIDPALTPIKTKRNAGGGGLLFLSDRAVNGAGAAELALGDFGTNLKWGVLQVTGEGDIAGQYYINSPDVTHSIDDFCEFKYSILSGVTDFAWSADGSDNLPEGQWTRTEIGAGHIHDINSNFLFPIFSKQTPGVCVIQLSIRWVPLTLPNVFTDTQQEVSAQFTFTVT